jgi:uncharacterized protein YifE (UPF0438 family)
VFRRFYNQPKQGITPIRLLNTLLDGQIEESNAEDEGLLAAAIGNKEPNALCEKAWIKYQKRINRPKPSFICRGEPAPDKSSDDSDIEIEVDEQWFVNKM